MLCRQFFKIFLLFSVTWTATIAAATADLWTPDNCGVSSILSKAIGTSKAGLQKYPWIAALKYEIGTFPDTQVKIRCTGTLINKRYILTTAYCANPLDNTLVAVTLGSTEIDVVPLQEFKISKNDVIIHPDYKLTENDIALIRLPKDADESIIPICLPTQDNVKNVQLTHNVTVTGWFSYFGAAIFDHPHPEVVNARIPVVPNIRCAQKFAKLANITMKHLCADDATSFYECATYGGSPLTDEVDLAGIVRTVQYGIASFGTTGCNNKAKKFPIVYTRVSSYTDWIVDNIDFHLLKPNLHKPSLPITELFPSGECGVTTVPNKGIDTNKPQLQEYFPWIAALKYKLGKQTQAKTLCTGTFISKRYILTAGYCAKPLGKIALVEIVLGSTENDVPPLQIFRISENDITVHPKYKPRENDIALIRLPTDVDDSVTPICLPIQDDGEDQKFTHSLTVAGWFSYFDAEVLNNSYPEFQKANIPLVPNIRCIQKYSGLANITQKHLCAGDETTVDACARYSGSPLMNEVNLAGVIRTVQYGIVSFGTGGCSDNSNMYPRVYTRVSSYTDWILDNIKS